MERRQTSVHPQSAMDSLASSHRQRLRTSEDLPAAFDEMEGRNDDTHAAGRLRNLDFSNQHYQYYHIRDPDHWLLSQHRSPQSPQQNDSNAAIGGK